MAKSSNPVDAHRKALRQKELKKNKEARSKARETAVIKKDTRSLKADIRELSSKAQQGPLTALEKTELASLRAELARIDKAKQEYVEAHPEHRKLILGDNSESDPSSQLSNIGADPPGLYGRDGKLKHPERSIYYDAVFNPFGAPPPGMPYQERPPLPEELTSQRLPEPITGGVVAEGKDIQEKGPEGEEQEEEEDSEEDDKEESSDEDDSDEIKLPEGPPPPRAGSDEESSSGDDDVPMPPGPPAPQHSGLTLAESQNNARRVNISRPRGGPVRGGGGGGVPPYHQGTVPRYPRHAQPFHPDPHMRHHPYPPSNPANLPPRPNMGGVPGNGRFPHQVPPPPPSFSHPSLPSRPHGAMTASDPLSEGPQQTFQSFQEQQQRNRAQGGVGTASAGSISSATISAAPQLRDLKKEATAFVPMAMRKKKGLSTVDKGAHSAMVAGVGRIDAAPTSVQDADGGRDREKGATRASLLGALKDVGIGPVAPASAAHATGTQKRDQGKEDYERFQREMQSFL